MTIELIETLTSDTNKLKTVKVYYTNGIHEQENSINWIHQELLTSDTNKNTFYFYTIIPAINGFNVFEGYWQYAETKQQALKIARQIIKQDKLNP